MIAIFSSKYDTRQYPIHTSYFSIECELSEDKCIEKILSEIHLSREYTDCDREIVDRSFLFDICRSEIHRNTCASRKEETGVLDRASDTFFALLDCDIGESHDRELTHPECDVDFYLDFRPGKTMECKGLESVHRTISSRSIRKK